VLVAGLAGWLLSRRGQFAQAVADSEASLRGLKSEAEDVLRVLGEETKSRPRAAASRVGTGAESAAKGEGEDAGGPAPAVAKPKRGEDEAELLDEASSDPEIQLDLARAYISMGDKEAARVILQEVVSNGTEEQQAEANKMLERL
jgi:pilus assembly protein FimV